MPRLRRGRSDGGVVREPTALMCDESLLCLYLFYSTLRGLKNHFKGENLVAAQEALTEVLYLDV